MIIYFLRLKIEKGTSKDSLRGSGLGIKIFKERGSENDKGKRKGNEKDKEKGKEKRNVIDRDREKGLDRNNGKTIM